jgi:transcriptional regulator with XRE-family HTH domain
MTHVWGEAVQAVPSWDTADRMRKALRVAGVSVQEMADYLGVARNTVSTWINGRITPSTQTLRLWAARCDVPYEWLTHSHTEACVRKRGFCRPQKGRRKADRLGPNVIVLWPAVATPPVFREARTAA